MQEGKDCLLMAPPISAPTKGSRASYSEVIEVRVRTASGRLTGGLQLSHAAAGFGSADQPGRVI